MKFASLMNELDTIVYNYTFCMDGVIYKMTAV